MQTKAFGKVQQLFMIKTCIKVAIGGTYVNIIKAIYENSLLTSYSIVKLKYFPLKSGTKQGCTFSPLLFNTILEVLAIAIRQEKETNDIQIRMEEVKLSLFADDMTLYIENSKFSTKKTIRSKKWIQ